MTTPAKARILRRVVLGGIALLLGAQFIRSPLDNRGEAEGQQSFAAKLNPPEPVLQYLRESCYDCHSDHTRYPWYAQVQPVGWMVARDIRKGTRALNLSTFGTLGKTAQVARLEWMLDDFNEGEMPDWSYRLLHPQAQLSAPQLAAITGWIQNTIAAIDTQHGPTTPDPHAPARTSSGPNSP